MSILVAVLALSVLTAGAASASDPPAVESDLYIVQLSERPLVRQLLRDRDLPASRRLGRLDLTAPANAAWLAHLDRRQEIVVTAAEQALGRRLRVVFRYRYAFAGFAVELRPGEEESLAALPGVARVRRGGSRRTAGDAGPAWIGADTIWDGTATGGLEGTKGEGVIVGVIDSGIEVEHPSFAEREGEVFRHENPLGEGNYLGWCDPANPSYDESLLCNEKLIGLWDFVDAVSSEADGPADSDGHGTQVASVAAGISVTTDLRGPATEVRLPISGVAPHAAIVAYDVCSTSCPLSSLVAGIDQAVADGVDVIVYAISGAANDPWGEPDDLALLTAFEAGVAVVAAAGNTGPTPGGVTSPAAAPWVVAVGAASHDRAFVASLGGSSGGSTPPGDLAGRSLTTADHGPAPIVHAVDFGGDPLCLSPFPANTWTSDEIVVCDRGAIARVAKGANVAAGGAGGFVLANTAAQGGAVNADLHVLPAVHLDATAGDQLRAWLSAGSSHSGSLAGAEATSSDAFADQVQANSARGPNGPVPDVLKPNLVAPGSEVLAASIGPEYYATLSDSSASAASVAGGAALLRALHPAWGPAAIRSALETTGEYATLSARGAAVLATTPFERGSGRVEMRDAGRVALVLEETAERFAGADPAAGGEPWQLNLAGLARADCPWSCSWERGVTGVRTLGWATSVMASDGLVVTVTPDTFDVDAGVERELTITAAVDRAVPLDSWLFAEIVLTPRDDELPEQHLTLAVRVPPLVFADDFEGGDGDAWSSSVGLP